MITNDELSTPGAGNKVFLIGFMGSGKTHWGSVWAEIHGLTFLDLDLMIEKSASSTVADIFENTGEEYFRLLEAKKLRTLAQKQHAIVACGGGTPCFHNNMEWMKENGTTIYLQATPQEILERVISEQEKRPLIKKLNPAELLFFIQKKLQEREEFYEQADLKVTSSELTPGHFTDIFINL